MRTVLTVKQLNSYVKSLLEGDVRLASVYLRGEISNFKNHYQSGHLYFSLKDGDAVIRAVMFRASAAYLKFLPEDGMSVICRGRVSLYERDGSYQFYAEEMIPDGVGDLAVAFEQIKNRLEKKGYFDPLAKKPIPKFPKKICVITSQTGAAVRDILNILERRYPICEVTLFPTLVQGENAASDLANAVISAQDFDFDTIIIGRGGGSIEDLWAFNDEMLAETIYKCRIPVISAVGHETDFTICDFVADLRAPTPSAAAELAVPDVSELRQNLDSIFERICYSYNSLILSYRSKLSVLTKSSVLFKNDAFFERQKFNLQKSQTALTVAFSKRLDSELSRFKENVSKLDALSPLSILHRGYSVVTSEGNVVTDGGNLLEGEEVNVKFAKGAARCGVIEVFKE